MTPPAGDPPIGPVEGSPLVLPAALSSVAAARRWVREALPGWGDDSLQGVLIVVSELVGNAVLHARTGVRLALDRHDPLARLEVSDGSPVAPLLKRYGPESPTGRGLHLIDLLCEEWGVRTAEDGKTIWAVLCNRDSGPADLAPRPTGDAGRVAQLRGPPRTEADAGDAADRPVSVRLLGMPAEVYFETQEHHDELLRELALLSGSRLQVPDDLGRLAREIRDGFLPSTADARAQLDDAARRVQGGVDVTITVGRRSLEALVRLSDLLEQADRFCADAALLTLPPAARVGRFRRWYAEQIARQLAGGEPTPWPADLPA